MGGDVRHMYDAGLNRILPYGIATTSLYIFETSPKIGQRIIPR